MDRFTGLLTQIKVIKEKPLWVRCTIITETKPINCIIADERISHQILMLPDDKYTVSVKGHFNVKDQLIIRGLRIIDKDDFTHKLGL